MKSDRVMIFFRKKRELNNKRISQALQNRATVSKEDEEKTLKNISNNAIAKVKTDSEALTYKKEQREKTKINVQSKCIAKFLMGHDKEYKNRSSITFCVKITSFIPNADEDAIFYLRLNGILKRYLLAKTSQ